MPINQGLEQRGGGGAARLGPAEGTQHRARLPGALSRRPGWCPGGNGNRRGTVNVCGEAGYKNTLEVEKLLPPGSPAGAPRTRGQSSGWFPPKPSRSPHPRPPRASSGPPWTTRSSQTAPHSSLQERRFRLNPSERRFSSWRTRVPQTPASEERAGGARSPPRRRAPGTWEAGSAEPR